MEELYISSNSVILFSLKKLFDALRPHQSTKADDFWYKHPITVPLDSYLSMLKKPIQPIPEENRVKITFLKIFDDFSLDSFDYENNDETIIYQQYINRRGSIMGRSDSTCFDPTTKREYSFSYSGLKNMVEKTVTNETKGTKKSTSNTKGLGVPRKPKAGIVLNPFKAVNQTVVVEHKRGTSKMVATPDPKSIRRSTIAIPTKINTQTSARDSIAEIMSNTQSKVTTSTVGRLSSVSKTVQPSKSGGVGRVSVASIERMSMTKPRGSTYK